MPRLNGGWGTFRRMMKKRRHRQGAVAVLLGTVVTAALVVKTLGFDADVLWPLIVGVPAGVAGGLLVLPPAFRLRHAIYGDEDDDT